MIDARPTRHNNDRVVKALRKLLDATDRSLAAADKLRRERIVLAKLLDRQSEEAAKS